MPIELRCSQCDTLLRVPDGSEGRETRCPTCQTMLLIPTPAGPPGVESGVAATPGPDVRSAEQEANPFAAPMAQPQSGFADGVSPFAGTPPTRLDIGDLLTRAFAIFSQNIGRCLAVGAILYYPPLLVMSALLGPVKAISMSAGGFLAPPLDEADYGRFAIAALINLPLSMFLLTGLACFSLQLARSGDGRVGLVFSGARLTLPILASYWMFFIAMMFGCLLCCVPGIWIAIVFSQFLWLIVDGRAGILDCFSRSKEITEGHRLNLFVLMVIIGGVSTMAGIIPYTALILQPIIYPMITILGALIYLTLTGQPIAGGAAHGLGDAPPEPPPTDSAN